MYSIRFSFRDAEKRNKFVQGISMKKIKHSGFNDSNEFVSCGRFVQFTDEQGLGCPIHKLILQKRRLDGKRK